MVEGDLNGMRITIHPLLLMMLLFVVLTKDLAAYSLLLLSLLFHECGHLLAAKCTAVQVKACVLLPYGGEIVFNNHYAITAKQGLIIALGGPVASIVGLLVATLLPEPLGQPLIFYQGVLLLVNCLPFWPLDGGRIIGYLLLVFMPDVKIYEVVLLYSGFFFLVILLASLFIQQYAVAVLSIFLSIQVYKEWRLRKYRAAYQKIVLNRLT